VELTVNLFLIPCAIGETSMKDIPGETVYGVPNWKTFLGLGTLTAIDLLLIGAVLWFLRAHGIL
jgi:hypothetical protein